MQNFGKIKNIFNGILVEGVVSKNNTNKLLFKKYVKTIKESEILKTQFLVYNNIENAIEKDSMTTNLFVQENLRLLEKFKPKDIISENKKLVALLEEAKANLDESYDENLASLHESLSSVIFQFATPKNLDSRVENFTKICKYIKSNKPKEINESIDLPTSMISTIMVDKYNEKYSMLDESEKKGLSTLVGSTDDEKKQVYADTLRECIDLVNESLKSDSIRGKSDVYEKLLNVKDKLLNDTIDINENFEQKISKLIELRTNLKDN
jgi:hypothetical protein